MAGAAVAADVDESKKGVLVAVDPHFDQRLGLAGRVALAPQSAARPRPIVDDSGRQRRPQSGLVHVATISTSPREASIVTQVARPSAPNFGSNALPSSRSLVAPGLDFRFDALVHPRLSSRARFPRLL